MTWWPSQHLRFEDNDLAQHAEIPWTYVLIRGAITKTISEDMMMHPLLTAPIEDRTLVSGHIISITNVNTASLVCATILFARSEARIDLNFFQPQYCNHESSCYNVDDICCRSSSECWQLCTGQHQSWRARSELLLVPSATRAQVRGVELCEHDHCSKEIDWPEIKLGSKRDLYNISKTCKWLESIALSRLYSIVDIEIPIDKSSAWSTGGYLKLRPHVVKAIKNITVRDSVTDHSRPQFHRRRRSDAGCPESYAARVVQDIPANQLQSFS